MSPKGISLTQLNIIVLSAFVLTAASINFGAYSGIWGFQMETKSMTDNRIDQLLDDIKSQFSLVLSGNGDTKPSYNIANNGSNDKISIQHNNISYEYYVDINSNLVKSVEGFEKIIAGNVKSLRIKELGGDKMIVTISSESTNINEVNDIEKMTKKYSTIIEKKYVT